MSLLARLELLSVVIAECERMTEIVGFRDQQKPWNQVKPITV